MLIQFSVGNYLSFKKIVTLSMVTTDLTANNKSVDENNVFQVDDELNLLKSCAVYGANASGKSNLVKAAEKLLEQHNPPNPVNDNPSTTVHLLVKELNKFVRP
ncbi:MULTISPECIES: AAA family ATPase [Okeania]|uniref:AAA family ATPase n=1 Tax=Okeania TaxID=1458928 RepID=UPI00195F5C60|nr:MULTISPECIES: hypothetical protein [Okeania]